MNDAITLITDEKEDLQTLVSAAKCFWETVRKSL